MRVRDIELQQADIILANRGKKYATHNLPCNDSSLDGLSFCYLKTKTNRFKRHIFVVRDGTILFYRRVEDENAVQSHPIKKSHLRLAKPLKVDNESTESAVFYPVQVDVPPDRTRLLYFQTQELQQENLNMLLAQQGFENRLDQYDLVEKLGDGAFSQVMLAQHRLTNEKFAMKIIPYATFNSFRKAQIAREVELQARSKNCPNVVRFKEQFTVEDMVCIVMENMPGGDLQQYLAQRQFKPVAEQMARHVLKQICEALKYLHSHRIIHRDIKLENVMLSDHSLNCQAKLADFGLAETVSSVDGDKQGTKAGTAGYAAPEIVEGRPYGTASDMWSLGVLLYAMLTVQLPFQQQETTNESRKKGGAAAPGDRRFHHSQEYNLSLSDVNASDQSKDLIQRLLVKEPELRLSVEEVLAHPFITSGE